MIAQHYLPMFGWTIAMAINMGVSWNITAVCNHVNTHSDLHDHFHAKIVEFVGDRRDMSYTHTHFAFVLISCSVAVVFGSVSIILALSPRDQRLKALTTVYAVRQYI